ncbi:hypothetical protein PBS_59480 [Paraburkholderia sp. 2C]|jgi:hypothetical protein
MRAPQAPHVASRSAYQQAETNMAEPLFLYGVYSIHVRPLALQGARWDAEYEIRHNEHAVQRWTTVGGDAGYATEAEAVESARRQAVADIDHGAGIPKPRAFP